MVEQLVDVFSPFDLQVPGQVFEVPMVIIEDTLRDARVANRTWRNSWRKCPRSSTSSSRLLTFQFSVLVYVVVEIFMVFTVDRVQQSLLEQSRTSTFQVRVVVGAVFKRFPSSRSLTFWFLLKVSNVFAQVRVPPRPRFLTLQLVCVMTRMSSFMSFSDFSPLEKSAKVTLAGGCRSRRGHQLTDAGGLCSPRLVVPRRRGSSSTTLRRVDADGHGPLEAA